MLLDCLTQFEAGLWSGISSRDVEMLPSSGMCLAGAGQLPQAQQQQDNKKSLHLALCVGPGCGVGQLPSIGAVVSVALQVRIFRGRNVGALCFRHACVVRLSIAARLKTCSLRNFSCR